MASVTLDRVSKRWGGFVGVDAPLLLRLPSLHALAAP